MMPLKSLTTGETITMAGELTADGVASDCRTVRGGPYPCDEHYVVRADGVWIRAFHNERDAGAYARAVATGA